MSDEKPKGQVIQIDKGHIGDHLDDPVRDTMQGTPNAILDAEADQLCGAAVTSVIRLARTLGAAATSERRRTRSCFWR